MSLSEEYRCSGHAVARGVLDAATLDRAERHLAGLVTTPTGVAACSPAHDDEARALGSDERVVGLARLVLDAEPELFGVSYLVKRAGDGLPVLWHQDGYPWREQLGVVDAVTLWVALDPADQHNGCLRVVPGSHRLPLRPLRPNPVENVFGWECDPDLVDESAAVDVVLAPGDVSLHHPALLHSSGPNRSGGRRAALALRYRSA